MEQRKEEIGTKKTLRITGYRPQKRVWIRQEYC